MEPLKIKIKNFYAMNDGEIDFTKFSSALILGQYENNPLKSNGSGKCLHKDTIVYDPIANEAITIETFVKEKRKKIFGLSNNNKIIPIDVIDWHFTGNKKTYIITLDSGAQIICANSHPLLTINGCKRVDLLELGEYVGEASQIPLTKKGNIKISAVDTNIVWSKIISIKEDSYADTYDVTIDSDKHIYLANSIYVHNSSIFESICWVIFNETRQTKVDDVIRWNAPETLVEFEFKFGQNIYKILRRRSRIAKETSVSFFVKENNKWINDSGTTNSETNKKILTLLKIDAKIFLNSVYFKQHDISLFANSSPSDRKKIIKSIMKLERWDDYQEKVKNSLKTIKDDIEKNQRIIIENNSAKAVQTLNKRALLNINDVIDTLVKKQKNMQNDLNSLFELKRERNLNNLLLILENSRKKVFDFKNSGKKMQNKINELSDLLNSKNNQNEKINIQTIEIKKYLDDLNKQINILQKQNCQYDELENEIISQKVEKNRLENILNDLNDTSSKVGIGQCKICFSEITQENIIHIHTGRVKQEKFTKKELNTTLKKLKEILLEYKNRKNNKDKFDILSKEYEIYRINLERIQEKKQSNDNEILYLNNEISVLSVAMREIVDQLISLKIDIESLEYKIEQQKINNIDIEIAYTEEQNRILLSDINSKNIELGILLNEKDTISKKIQIFDIATDELNKLNKNKVSNEQLARFFGKDGIQAVFIESIVDELEQCANATLAHICNEPTIIRLKTQKKNGDSWQETLEIDVVMNGFSQTFESLGGGEMFRISLALRIGLSEVLVKRAGGEIKLLLFDEIDSPLDVYGLNNLFESIIKGLEKRFKVLVISHNNIIRERFSNVINVVKTSNGSFVTQD